MVLTSILILHNKLFTSTSFFSKGGTKIRPDTVVMPDIVVLVVRSTIWTATSISLL